ncbi:elongation factor P 5-aminopentanone reductase [Murdochiella vaginalis]|uniref:elongation factor P 5-aminopentanone reductase n=1 Tax=Murdochiella vaginalis TaxID=1852373 RepID=UPI0008FDA180|nr:SDR family NAD(P)-dependent oxidoreductase [Murdochiella vaginalis]
MTSHTILITGASRGIGRACALALARPDVKLIIHYHLRAAAAEETADLCRKKGAEAFVLQADIASSSEVNRLFLQAEQHFSPVDIVVNNVGVAVYGQLQDISDDEWQRVFATNVNGMFYCTRRALPGMISRKWGRIINVSSMWGQVGASCEVLYSATKGAVDAFTKAAAKELVYSGITVNAVSPGVVDTDMFSALGEDTAQDVVSDIPLGRTLRPQEIALWVRHFAAEEAEAVTGQILGINGGMEIH